jgi:hypothetical protein
MSDDIRMYVVYDNPSDYPSSIVVRTGIVQADGSLAHSDVAVWGYDGAHGSTRTREETLAAVREGWLASRGLVCMARHPDDDPVIVETWL